MEFENTKFYGGGYDEALDQMRLSDGIRRVADFIVRRKGFFLTLEKISLATNKPEASVSAALRTLRNQYGFVIDKARASDDGVGLWLYMFCGIGDISKRKNKMQPVGDPVLWGEVMRQIYICAHAPAGELPLEAVVRKDNAKYAFELWGNDMVARIRKGESFE